MTIEADVEDISQLLTDKLGGQEALDRIVGYVEEKEQELAVAYGSGRSELEQRWFSALDRATFENDVLRKERDEARIAGDGFHWHQEWMNASQERDEWKDHAEVFGTEVQKLRKERDELKAALECMHKCERAERTHAMPKDPNDRAWCLDCREWCYSSDDMACSGCIVRAVLQRIEGDGS